MVSVIIPTLWKPKGFLQRLEAISKNPNVGEIVLIDNSNLHVDTSHIAKVRHIRENRNTYVIPAWNKGVRLSKYDKLLIVNDDVETDWSIITDVYSEVTEEKGLIGAGPSCWQSKKNIPELHPISTMPNCYACCFFIHKNSYTEIPEMKIHYGDNWIFDVIKAKGKTNYEIINWDMGGESEQTSRLEEFDSIKHEDLKVYNRLQATQSVSTNTCIFTTHTTLTHSHAEYSLKALLTLQNADVVWDYFVVYNTQEQNLPNKDIIELIKKYDTKNYIKQVLIFPYSPEDNKKNLLQDIRNWYDVGVSLGLQKTPGKILWLKSDYCVSNNFNEVFLQQSSTNTIWSLPTLGAKQKIEYSTVLSKLNMPSFSVIDLETYYRGGDNPNNQLPFDEVSPNGEMDYHPSINYVSHNYVYDFNLHVITNDTLEVGRQLAYHPQVFDMNSTWGGPHNLFYGLKEAKVHFSGEYKAYGIHMFHEIISENRLEDRGDVRKLHLGEKY